MSILYIVSKNEKHLLMEYKKNNPELNIDIMLDDELFAAIYGELNNAALTYLNNLGLSYPNASKIKNLVLKLKDLDFSINFKNKDNESLSINIKELYEEFLKRNYINKNQYIDLYLKNKEIILSPLCNNEEIKWLLKDYSYKVEDIKKNVTNRTIYKCESLTDSSMLLYSLIFNKVKENVNLEKIKIASSSDEFIKLLKSYNRFYNFPFRFVEKIKKNKILSYKKLFEELKTKSLKDSLQALSDDDLIQEFISIYIEMKDYVKEEDIINYFKYYGNNEISIKKEGVIEFVDKYYIPKKGEILFVPYFVSSCYPSPISDDTYPGDKEFEKAHILTSYQRNELENISFAEMYYASGEVVFLAHKKHNKTEFIDSTFSAQYKFNVIKTSEANIKTQVFTNDRIKNIMLSKYADYERLYGIKNEYAKQLKEVEEYLSYDNQYKPFDGFVRNKKDNMSFSLMNTYLECPFKYYLQNELLIDKFEGNESTRKGSIYHKFMENMSNDIIKPLSYYIDQLEDNREKVLLESSFESVIKAQELHDFFFNSSTFNRELSEKQITIDVDGIKFKGTIDSLFLDDKNKIAAIIDYKTSNKSFDKTLIDEGESMQLPLYLLLIDKWNEGYKPIGAYISNLSSSKYLKSKDESEFRLSGISDVRYLSYLIPQKYIEGLKIDKDGNYVLTKNIGTKEDIENLIKKAEECIKDVYYSIEKGEFPITPLATKKADACKFCTYKDICYKEELDDEYEEGEEND